MDRSPSSEVAEQTPGSRRKSGRVTRKPAVLSPSSGAGSAKRKRAAEADAEDTGESEDASDGGEEYDEIDEQDGAGFTARTRKARRTNSTKQKTSGPKRSKANGATTDLSIRTATSKSGALAKGKRIRKSAVGGAGGLYAEVFGNDENLDDVTAKWLRSFKNHEAKALTEIVNFVLRCTGCEHTVTSDDIEDPDNCTTRLTDLQDMFQANDIVDYPLIAKSKGAFSFKRNLTKFFDSLIKTIAAADLLHEQTELIENIQVWVGTMSSAANRPFRHTATIVSLAIISALCEVGRSLVEERAKVLRQSEGEQKKGRVNKARVNDLKKKADSVAERRAKLDEIIKEWFDVVFVHRYRDVDPRIRVDCVTYLTQWIMTYPDVFFDDQHLRYLGWVLSDIHAPTRLEVVKQLQRLFKDEDKITGLKQFTERFRPRMVEIATQDSEPNVRASTVELLDVLRDAGLLEPNDVDAIGRLIFDSEPRVRKAVVRFFAANVDDVYELKLDDVGGQEVTEEFLGDVDSENLEAPRLDWLKMKSLAELFDAYDSHDADDSTRKLNAAGVLSVASGTESRFGLAAEALMDDLQIIQQWEVLAAYLLFDHSRTASSTATDPKTTFFQICKPGEKEETILLEVLNTSVKYGLTKAVEAAADKKVKKTKNQKHQELSEHEEAAQRLAVLIPRLLKKFGATPDTVSAVLRLERVLNIDIFQDLRQDSSTYSALLDDINKQFMGHESQSVMAEASAALLHAKNTEELEEVADGKLQALWEDTTYALVNLCKGHMMKSRGNLQESVLAEVSNTVLRISNLASISSCTEPLETVKTTKPDKSRKKQPQTPAVSALSLLIDIISRGVPARDIEPEINAAENVLATNSCKCLLFYFMWKVRDLQNSIAAQHPIRNSDLDLITENKDATITALRSVLEHRHATDDVRLDVAGILLDLFTLFTTLRHVKPTKQPAAQPPRQNYLTLIRPIDVQTQALVLQTFVATEATFAKKTRRHLEAPSFDDDPEGSDDDDLDSLDGNDQAAIAVSGAAAALVAEEKLCAFASKIVLALISGVADSTPAAAVVDGVDQERRSAGSLRKRLLRNKMRLGPNFKEVCAFLERGGLAAKKGKGKLVPTVDADGPPAKKVKKSAAIVVDDESDDDDQEGQRQDEDVELLEEDGDGDDDNIDVHDQGNEELESVLGD